LLLSGQALDENLEFISKPYHMSELADRLRAIMPARFLDK
jgi:hypothetical protein